MLIMSILQKGYFEFVLNTHNIRKNNKILMEKKEGKCKTLSKRSMIGSFLMVHKG